MCAEVGQIEYLRLLATDRGGEDGRDRTDPVKLLDTSLIGRTLYGDLHSPALPSLSAWSQP
jgi:hypothetical protein